MNVFRIDRRRPTNQTALLAVVAGVWMSAVALGFCVFWSYGATPGRAARGAVAATRPAASLGRAPAGRASLVMFVHPQCPCSRASLDALAGLLADRRDALDASVVFADVADGETPVESSALWARATSMPGVRMRRDVGGALAVRFDAHTSGQAFCYAADGALTFSGGLTAARGQDGDSAGRRAVDATCAGVGGGDVAAPVFGCPLR